MRKKLILRLGVVGVVAAASGASAFAVGCSSSSDNTGTNGTDSGLDAMGFADSPASDSTTQDSATDAADAALPPNAKLTVVHAAPGVPAFRICFGLELNSAVIVSPGFFPLPNNAANQGPFPYLGLFPGTGGALADLGVNYSTIEIVGFIVNAEAIANNTSATTNELDCSQLIGTDGTGVDGGGLVLGRDYFQLPPIPKGALAPRSSYLLALEGCEPGNTAAAAQAVCGASYSSSTGNLSLELYQLDNSAPAGATMGVQFLHGSSAWSGELQAPFAAGGYGQAFASTVNIVDGTVFATDGGGANAPIAANVNAGSPLTPDAAAPQSVVPTDYATTVAVLTDGVPDGGPLEFPNPDGGGAITLYRSYEFPFTDIQQFSALATLPDGGPAGPAYLPGANFVLIWVGDPSQPMFIGADGGASSPDAGGSFNTASPHFLMFPSDPTLPTSN
jgi:hypothetical protein